MVQASKGLKRKTRNLRKKCREKGLSPITRYLQSFNQGEKACIKIDPSIHKGQPSPKFQGKIGEIIGMQGKAYLLKIYDRNKIKKIIIGVQHLRAVK